MWDPETQLNELVEQHRDATSRRERLQAAVSLAYVKRREPEAARDYLAEARDLIDGDVDGYLHESAHCDYVEQFLLGDHGEKVTAIRMCLELVDVFEQLDDQWGRISTTLSLVNYYNALQDGESAQPLAARLRKLDDQGVVPDGLRAATYYELAHTYHQLDVPEVARAYAKRVLQFDEHRYGAHYMLGLVEMTEGRLEQANEHFEQAHDLGLELENRIWTFAALPRLCETFRELRQPDRAVEVARASLARFPGGEDAPFGDAVFELGRALAAAGEHDEADRHLHAALTIYEAHATPPAIKMAVHKELAELSYVTGDYKAAAERFHTSAELQRQAAVDDKRAQLTLAAVRHEFQLSEQELEFTKAQADALWETNQQLRQSNQDQQEILAIVAHDLTNPLNSIGLTLELINRLAQSGSVARVPDLAGRVQSSLDYMLEVINQLTTMGRLDAGDIDLSLTPINLRKTVEMSIERNRDAIAENQTVVDFDIDKHITVEADIVYLDRVVDNLLSNAIKYSPPRSRVAISAAGDGPWVAWSVADSGVGMAGEEMSRLFTKFGRLSARPTTSAPSTGLGLYISKQLVESMGGEIFASSPGPSLGSTFTVRLRPTMQHAIAD